MYNDDNMLMTDLDLVDEQDYEDAMREAYEAMCEPDVDIPEDVSDEQREMIENINWVVNGCNRTLEKPLELIDDEDGTFVCEEIVYRERQLYAQNYDEAQDCWNELRLDGVSAESLKKLYLRLIDEIF